MTKKNITYGAVALLLLLIALEFVVKHKPHFSFDGLFAFAPLLGFFAVIAFAVVGWIIGNIIAKPGDRD